MKKKPVIIEDLLKFRYPENLQYSPDGKTLAFQAAESDTKKNSYHRDVWICKNGKAFQLTSTLNTSLLCWKDEEHLVLTRNIPDAEEGNCTLYEISIKGGEARRWIELPFTPSEVKKVNDDLYIMLAGIDRDDPDAYKDSDEIRKQKQEQKKKDKDYQVVDEVPYWFNGRGFINAKRSALFAVSLSGGLRIRRITDRKFNTGSFTVHGNTVYFAGNHLNRRQSLFDKVYAYHCDTGRKETIYGKNGISFQFLFVLNDTLYAQATDSKEFGLNETGNIVKVEKDKLTFITDPERSLYCSTAGDTMLGGGKSHVVKDDCLITLATNDDHTEIWRYDGNFEKTVLYAESGAVFFLDAGKDKIAFVRETADALGEVFEMDLNGKHIRKLTDLNTGVLKDKYVAMPQRIDYVSGGEDLHGWVLLPDGYSRNKKYPAVLDIHGGPRAVYGEIYFHEMQVWVSKGYIVMFTNIRGSDGRDDAFADIRGQYGFTDYQNLMDFTDAVLTEYANIDQSKLCVTGGSYGGFMTNWIITHTSRFCAAASQRSISNWVSMTFISDIGLYFCTNECGAEGLFDEADTEKLWRHSPLKYAKGAKTPTLFIHSDEDYRCPLPEGMQMMQALAAQNVETRMVIFHGENHGLSRSGKPEHRLRRLREITDWFEQHTK